MYRLLKTVERIKPEDLAGYGQRPDFHENRVIFTIFIAGEEKVEGSLHISTARLVRKQLDNKLDQCLRSR